MIKKINILFVYIGLMTSTIVHAQLLTENFNSGIPGTWTVTTGSSPADNSPSQNWRITSGGFNSGPFTGLYVDGATEFAVIESTTSGLTNNDELISPAISASGYTSLNLIFDQVYNNKGSADKCEIEAYNGVVWTKIATYTSDLGAWGTPDHRSIDVITACPSCATNSLQFKFRYLNGNTGAWYWGIDNVVVSGSIGAAKPTADFSASKLNTCESNGDTITLTDLSTDNPTSWEWTITPSTGFSYVNGTNNSSENPQIFFNTNGFYTIKLKATNSSGSDSIVRSNYLNIKPIPTVNPGVDLVLCEDYSGFALSGSFGGSATGAQWSTNGGLITNNTSMNGIFTPDSSVIPGTIYVVLTSLGTTCLSVSDSIKITYTAISKVDAGINVSSCELSSVNLNGVFKNATGIKWSGGSGVFNPDNTTKNAIYTPTQSEIDAGKITLFITSVGGCSDKKDSVTFAISDSCGGLSVEKDNCNFIKTYPNPTSNILSLDLNINKYNNNRFTIVNTIGEVLIENKIENKVTNIDVSELTNGIYFLKIEVANEVFTKKILIKK